MKKIEHNYLPEQYEVTNELPINHNYLPQQFADSEKVFDEIRQLVLRGDFTLGTAVNEFEDEFKKITKTITCSIKQIGATIYNYKSRQTCFKSRKTD